MIFEGPINLKIAVVLGTRPEIIKMSPIIRELEKRNEDYFILHSGQHYSYNMDKVFFEQLNLPLPKYNLDAGSGPHGEQTGKILSGIERVFLQEPPDVVLVQGDTNTVLAGALAAAKMHIKVGHVEAGLRSYDRKCPRKSTGSSPTIASITFLRRRRIRKIFSSTKEAVKHGVGVALAVLRIRLKGIPLGPSQPRGE
jgi:UDP-N-acetylglucosamine 2-epimerase